MQRLPVFSHRSGFKAAWFYLLLGLCSTPVAANCPSLTRVDIEPDEILTAAQQRKLTEKFIGKCIDADLTRQLLAAVSSHFFEQGYVTTRPYLLEQDISDGQLEIRILPGRIEAIVDAATGEGDARLISAFLSSGELLNLRELESALETIERVPSVEAEFEIRPGSLPGASVVAVEFRETRPLRLELGANAQTDLDNQLGLLVALDNPLRINDILELRVNDGKILEHYQTNSSESLTYSFPLGDILFTLSRSDISFEQRIQGVGGSFVSEGETIADSLRVDKTVARSQFGIWGLALTLDLKDTKNFFEDQLIEVSSYKTSQLQLELRHDWLLAWGQVSSYFIVHRGLDSFGARDDDFFVRDDGAEAEARLQFTQYSLGGQLIYLFDDPAWQCRLNLHMQVSDDILFDSDKLNLGSPFTVRGYSSALSGSNAGYLRTNLVRQLGSGRRPAGSGRLAKSIEVFSGLDYGEVKCEIDNPDSCGDIYGLGIGAAVRDRNFSGRVSWGHPLKRIGDGVGDEDRWSLDFRWVL